LLELKVKFIDIDPNYPLVILNKEDMADIAANTTDRVEVTYGNKSKIVVVDSTEKLVKKGYIGLNRKAMKYGITSGTKVFIDPAETPESVEYIKKKLKGIELSRKECNTIIDDINANKLSDIELGAFVSAIYVHDYTPKELVAITERMVSTGIQFKWKNNTVVADKHCIGGVPGNRTTPIVIAIAATCGITIPKTSSRAITSPAGTADTLEVFCNVNLTMKQIEKIVEKTGACFAWGGSVDLAPSDDKIIKAEYPLSLDPEGQLIASVLAKKKAIGSNAVVIDIPYGFESKVDSLENAEKLAGKFKMVGKKLDMNVDCAITHGNQPIGNGIGPVLECIDIIEVLNGRGPDDLREKCLELAGILLRLVGKGDIKTAENILDSKKALKKFNDIIVMQGGKKDIDLYKLLGKYKKTIFAKSNGKVTKIFNKQITRIARIAGAPKDKGAGIYLYTKLDTNIKKGDRLFDIYAETEFKLKHALYLLKAKNPVLIEAKKGILVEEI